MASSEALKRAIKKYDQEKIDRISLRVAKGKKETIYSHATQQNESVNAFINRAIDQAMESDSKK